VLTAAIPILTVVPAFANVTALLLHPMEDEPVVSIVCEPPSEVTILPMQIRASFAASKVVAEAVGEVLRTKTEEPMRIVRPPSRFWSAIRS
jgi:hypothetical protein